MMGRGANNFVFLGRSGDDKPSARDLISQLRNAGASVSVVRGDVSNTVDVAAAVAACNTTGKTIGGVVQAAMGLSESLFYQMTSEAWHTAVRPKLAGTWNLHNQLEGHQLDFFLLTSSITGSIGAATETNYCAANSFLDAFARWRRGQGKPATAIGLGMISEVGYLHDNPETESLLSRKGIRPLNEKEFLQVIDIALSEGPQAADSPSDNSEKACFLTGLEPLRIQGHEVLSSIMDDPRLGIIVAAGEESQGSRGRSLAGRDRLGDNAAPWMEDLPAGVASILVSEVDAASINSAVLRLISKRLSSLILTSVDQIDHQKPLVDFGIDSMIGAEFRSWVWNTFKVDIPFIDIISSRNTLSMLADTVVAELTSVHDGKTKA